MADTLDQVWRRYTKDSKAFAGGVRAPVIVFELPDTEPLKTLSTHQLHTIPKSGYQIPYFGPAATVVSVAQLAARPPDLRIKVGRTVDNDLAIDHPSISRWHAWFEQDKRGAWQLADAGSRNGTVVNSKRLSARMLTALGEQATIGFGDVNAQFFVTEAWLAFLGAYQGG